MDGFRTLVTYRSDIDEALEIIPIDNEQVVIGLQALGVKPVNAKTDGRKLIVSFLKDEASDPYQRMMASLAGVLQPNLQVDLNLIFSSQLGWRGLLTMMRSVPVAK